MEPTPLPTESDASYGFTLIMNNLGYLRQQAEANNKRPFPATEDEVKALVKLAERERPLVVKVTTEAVVEQIMGKTGESVAKFQSLYNQFLLLLEAQAKALKQDLATQATAMQTAAKAGGEAAVAMQTSAVAVAAAGKKVREDLPTSLPVSGRVYGFTDWKTAVGCLLGPVVLLLLVMAVTGQFSKVDKEAYERVKADYEQMKAADSRLKTTNGELGSNVVRYEAQIKRYRAKNPKTTDFPR